jgi:hypothetical protein
MAASEVAAKLSPTATSTTLSPGEMRFGNSDTLGGAGATSYLCPEHMEAISDGVERVWVAPCAGVMRGIYGHTSAAHGQAGETVTLTVQLAGAPQALVIVFAAATTDVADTAAAHAFAFTAGARISVKCVATHALAKLANVSVTLNYTRG